MYQLSLPGFLPTFPALTRQGWHHWYPYDQSWIGIGTIVGACDIATRRLIIITITLVQLGP